MFNYISRPATSNKTEMECRPNDIIFYVEPCWNVQRSFSVPCVCKYMWSFNSGRVSPLPTSRQPKPLVRSSPLCLSGHNTDDGDCTFDACHCRVAVWLDRDCSKLERNAIFNPNGAQVPDEHMSEWWMLKCVVNIVTFCPLPTRTRAPGSETRLHTSLTCVRPH